MSAEIKSLNNNVINRFRPATADHIFRTSLIDTAVEDQRVWWPESSSTYSVRSAYRTLMERVLDTGQLLVEGDWRVLWKMKIPPKVKHLLWRLCRDVLPT